MDRQLVSEIVDEIKTYRGRPLTFMEVCGTHTMSAARFGIRDLLPNPIRLISGPGCPVCVTPVGYVDHALALATQKQVAITTFGDMMRVPGSGPDQSGFPNNLSTARANGADVRVVYSPLDALAMAEENPTQEVIFLGVGFETTAPGLALTIKKANEKRLTNFSMLLAAKTIPETMFQLARADDVALDGFLLPGHVSAVLGYNVYRPFATELKLACSVAGFEPLEMLFGIRSLVRQVMAEQYTVDNCYAGVVKPDGNPIAIRTVYEIFEPCSSVWRGIGEIPHSGLTIKETFAAFDAARKFDVSLPEPKEPSGCRCGDVLKGKIAPEACGLFGRQCTPSSPRGACMVSSEGSCAASYNYRFMEDE